MFLVTSQVAVCYGRIAACGAETVEVSGGIMDNDRQPPSGSNRDYDRYCTCCGLCEPTGGNGLCGNCEGHYREGRK